VDGKQVDQALDEWYETILLLQDFDSQTTVTTTDRAQSLLLRPALVVLTVREYRNLPAAFLDVLRFYRRLKHA
jgi:hypothetical protein